MNELIETVQNNQSLFKILTAVLVSLILVVVFETRKEK